MRNLQELSSCHFSEVTPEEWLFLENEWIVNDCWWAWNDIKNRFIRWFLRFILRFLKWVFIEASCKIHDFKYWQGWTEDDRYKADFWFYKKIISDISEKNWFFCLLWYTILALVFYGAVRVGGKSYFNYK